MSDIVISVAHLTKYYEVFDKPYAKLMNAFFSGYDAGMTKKVALDDVSFDIRRGESVAIIGRNGGGKSTLLQIITGTLKPSGGVVNINGRVSALLELGSGFNPELSGRENVVLNGLLLGLKKGDILQRFDEIEAFADIGDAIDRPVKTYSSGMVMRLAFAVQVLCDPEILIIDEALSVGDFFFQQKCLKYIRSLCEKGVTLLFVSHDMSSVRDLCSRAIYLKKGRLEADGNVSNTVSKYLQNDQNAEDNSRQYLDNLSLGHQSFDGDYFETAFWQSDKRNKPVNGQLLSINIYNRDGNQSLNYCVGEKVRFVITYLSDLKSDCHAALSLVNKYGQVSTITGSYFTGTALPKQESDKAGLQFIVCEIEMDLMLEVGQYSFDVSTGVTTKANEGQVLDSVRQLGPITLGWDFENRPAPFLGLCGLPINCNCYKKDIKKYG